MNDIRTIRVAMAGCGTVGSGVAAIVVDRAEELAARTGLRFELVRVLVSDVSKPRYIDLAPDLFTSDLAAFNRTPADMVVEVLGGTTTAREVVTSAVRRGLPVVTANKALLALHGVEIFKTARARGACVAFEASCLGGLPTIGTLLRGLQANRIEGLWGMFNSTCNFVLTRMLHDSMSFADAVRLAQEKGYAEADPTLDIDGSDTAHKLVILASLAFGKRLTFDQVAREGIQNLQLADLRLADQLGYACKLLGVGRRVYVDNENNTGRHDDASELITLQVRPTLVPKHNPLALLNDTYSAMFVRGDALGDTLYAGGGAGSLPTASGVVADMIDVALGAAAPTFDGLRVFFDRTAPAGCQDPNEAEGEFFVRFGLDADTTSPAALERAWQRTGVPVRLLRVVDDHRAVALFTAPVTRKRMRAAVQAVAGAEQLTSPPLVLHVMAEDGTP